MTIGAKLPCPSCGRLLDSSAWIDDESGWCQHCDADFDFMGFPALDAQPARVVPKAVLVAEHATCFHHPENQAEAVCETCGRFLCAVCAINFAGRLLCPECIRTATRSDINSVGSRVLYDGIALSLAVLPLLVWPVTLVTAPVALGSVFVGWRKPRSLVKGGRARLVAAGLIAVAEIVGWVFLFAFLWLRKKR
ncbi:MAG TPA: B-box zinc finger protein [Opitutaceae bacterium]|nr:B-box zinc finger protein [Opitutaceae bacterium]